MKKYNSKINKISLVIEIVLALAICIGLAVTSQMGLSTSAENFSTEVFADYKTLTKNYIRAFKVLRMEAVRKIKEDPSFDEMLVWTQSKEAEFRDAVGEDIFDGFAFSYKGGYARSWDYGDYTNYDATTRPWYQQAVAADGEIVVVAPYQTFLANTAYIETYDTLRLSIAQMYSEEISFDFDLTVEEINALLSNRQTIYDGTKVFLYDQDGYILSSTDEEYYGHNVKTADAQVSQGLSELLTGREEKNNFSIHCVDGTLRQVFRYTDEEGKTVCLYKPVKGEKREQIDLSGVKLLLAEDNEMNMEIAVDILRKAGLVITPVTDGEQALKTFEASAPGTFDAILMDIQMPVMDGYTATKKIRESEHPLAKSIPIIAMTANAFTEDVTTAFAAGMNDHVAKPISYDRLFRVLSKCVREDKR